MDRKRDRQSEMQTDKKTVRKADKQSVRQSEMQTDKKTVRKADRQEDSQ